MGLGDVFQALSDPTRRQILHMLSRGDLSAGEIAAAFSLSKPSISHHLGMLREAGLVLSRRRGQMIIYSLHTTVLQEALGWGFDILRAGEARDRGNGPDER
jgi:DNA-binding transcriptional ArsR family regulator